MPRAGIFSQVSKTTSVDINDSRLWLIRFLAHRGNVQFFCLSYNYLSHLGCADALTLVQVSNKKTNFPIVDKVCRGGTLFSMLFVNEFINFQVFAFSLTFQGKWGFFEAGSSH